MSTIAEAAPQTHDTLVRLDAAGKPLAIRHDGGIWLVDPDTESRHWYGRDAWWDTRRTAAVDSGDLVSTEYWQVQVRSGTHSALRTATLRREPLSTHWLLENISDADDQTWAGIRTEFTLPTLQQVRRRLSELMEDPEPVMRQLVRVFLSGLLRRNSRQLDINRQRWHFGRAAAARDVSAQTRQGFPDRRGRMTETIICRSESIRPIGSI